MDKVWFTLRQTHYPAPDIDTLGTANETGPVLLGHLVPSLERLDFVINSGSILPFPLSMRVWPTTAVNVLWSKEDSHITRGVTNVSVPTPASASVGGKAAIAFQKTVDNAWTFRQLSAYIVQPNESYIRKVLDLQQVDTWIRNQKFMDTWSMYMITGIMIAKAASFQKNENGRWSIEGGPQVSLPTIVETELQGEFSRGTQLDSSGKITTDFVWAVRLAKISRSSLDVVLQHDWSIKTATKGATFSSNPALNVQAILHEEGLEAEVIEDVELDMAFVM